MRTSVSPRIAVIPHLLRLVPTLQMSVLGGLALVLCAVPFALSLHPLPGDAATLLRVAALPCTIAVAFALDDPAARVTATVPLPLLWRRLLRLTLTLAPLAAVWTVCGLLLRAALEPAERIGLPLPGLALEAAALAMGTALLATAGLRLSTGERSSGLAAPASVLLPLGLVVTPFRSELFPMPLTEGWAGTRFVWGLALAVLAGATAVLLREHPPVRRNFPNDTGRSAEPTRTDRIGEHHASIRP